MFPNLLQATNEYWRKLNALETAYQNGEVSIEEVDTRVAELMAELGTERREAVRFLATQATHFWHQQKEAIVGVAVLSGLTYAWFVINLAA